MTFRVSRLSRILLDALPLSSSTFKTQDLTKLNTEAAGAKIGNSAQAVANATKISGYLAASGGGKKQITSLGEQMVNALPDQEAVRKVLAEKPKKRRVRRTGSSGKTKAR